MSTTNYIVRKLWLNSHFRQETQLWALSRIKQFCPLWGAKPSRFCLRRGGIVPHRLSNPPTHALYALGACMSVPLIHSLICSIGRLVKYILI